MNQGINIRTIDTEAAQALASITLRDDQFKTRRLYTAWDNIGDEQRFFAGVDTLEAAGIPPTCLLVYMLVGFDRRETWERVLYRFRKMTARGIRPFPMVFGDRKRGLPLGDANHRLAPRTLGEFQRWAIRRLYSGAQRRRRTLMTSQATVMHQRERPIAVSTPASCAAMKAGAAESTLPSKGCGGFEMRTEDYQRRQSRWMFRRLDSPVGITPMC